METLEKPILYREKWDLQDSLSFSLFRLFFKQSRADNSVKVGQFLNSFKNCLG